MRRTRAAESLRAALVRQFGASARGVVEREVDGRLAGKTRLAREDLDAIERGVQAALRVGRREAAAQGAGSPAGVGGGPPKAAPSPAASAQPSAQPSAQTSAAASRLGRTQTAPGSLSSAARGLGPLLADASDSSASALSPLGSLRSLRTPVPTPVAMTPLAEDGAAGAATEVERTRPAHGAVGAVWSRRPGPASPAGGPACGTLARVAPLRPKRRPIDHFDLLTEYADTQHLQAEQAKALERRDKNAKFRALLDGQLAEQRVAREEEQDAVRRDREFADAKAQEHREAEEALAKSRHTLREAQQRCAGDDQAVLERRRQREGQARVRDREELAKALEMERLRAERKEAAKREVHAARSRAVREEFVAAAADRGARRAAEQVADRAFSETQQRMAASRVEGASDTYRERQAIVDRFTETLGAAGAAQRARQEQEFEERIEKASKEFERRRVEDYWRGEEQHDATLRTTSTFNLGAAQTQAAARGQAEKDADAWQVARWREEAGRQHLSDEAAAERARQRRAEVSAALWEDVHSNAQLHPLEMGFTMQARQREVSYNKRELERLAAEGFRKELAAQTLSLAAAAAR